MKSFVDKIQMVKTERNAIVRFPRLAGSGDLNNSSSPQTRELHGNDDRHNSALLEQERQRMETLRRRQEKEMTKMIEREHALAELQEKLKAAEDLEILKQKKHEKRVAEQKSLAAKKQTQRLQELSRQEHEVCLCMHYLSGLRSYLFDL